MKSLSKLKSQTGLWMNDAPIPKPGPNDVLIKIKKTAICGTDLHIYNWDKWSQATIKTPMIIGHEYSGVIHELGANIDYLKMGDRVSGEGHICCAHCRNCKDGKQHLCPDTKGVGVNRDGAFAEFLCVPAINVVKLPDVISDDIGAILDPLGNAVHTALSFDMVGEDILITGAGPIGIMGACIADYVGARNVVLTDINEYRLDLAKKMLPKLHIMNVQKQNLKDIYKELNMVSGFDVGLEMSGNQTAILQLIDHMYQGGEIALLGIPPEEIKLDLNKIIFKGLTLKGIYGREMYQTWYKMIALLESGLDVSKIITHHFPVDDFEKAFEVANSGQSGKVILEW